MRTFPFSSGIPIKSAFIITVLGIVMGIVVFLMGEASSLENSTKIRSLFLSSYGGGCVVFLVALWCIHKCSDSRFLWVLIAFFGVSYRLYLLPTALILEDDIFRYLWDGKVVAHGLNPYEFSPATVLGAHHKTLEKNVDFSESQLFRLNQLVKLISTSEEQSEDFEFILSRVNYPEVPTIYPPLTQYVFAVGYMIKPGSIIVLKAFMVFFELSAILIVFFALGNLGLKQTFILIPAWCPLMLKEFANSGHHDAIPLFFVTFGAFCLIKKNNLAGGVFLGLATLSKLYPILFILILFRRLGLKGFLSALVIIGLGYMPFLATGLDTFDGFNTFARDWQFNGGVFVLLRNTVWWFSVTFLNIPSSNAYTIGVTGAKVLCGIFLCGIFALLTIKKEARQLPPHIVILISFGFLIFVSPVVNPWYLGIIVPLLALYPFKSLLWLTLASSLSYFRDSEWVVPYGVRLIEFIPTALLAVWDYKRFRKDVSVEKSNY